MFAELAISPSVFLGTSFASPDVCDAHLSGLKDVLLNSTLTRDLRGGSFSTHILGCVGLHERGKELLKQMIKRRRLIPFPAALEADPETSADWIREAMRSHEKQPLTGMLSCAAVKGEFDSPLVADIAKRGSVDWWHQEVLRSSWTIPRTIVDYQILLAPLFRHANSIRFIDPHLDPSQARYSGFGTLLLPLKYREEAPEIEIHRVCYSGSGESRRVLTEADIRGLFAGLSEQLSAHGLRATVFVWADDHDRHILTDIGGLMLGNGLDTSHAVDTAVTWSRIDRYTQDQISRRHDTAVNGKNLRFQFDIGG